MATAGTVWARLNSWATEEVRWNNQVNQDVLLSWYRKWLLQFQKMILEYVSWMQNTSHVFRKIEKDVDRYELPIGMAWKPDFYSIVQLRVAYHTDKNGNPLYRICKPMNFSDYNITPMKNKWVEDEHGVEHLKARWGVQRWGPMVWDRVSEITPRYIFEPVEENWEVKSYIKIFPTPTEEVTRGLTLTYNYMDNIEAIDEDTDEKSLNLPWYFFDAVEDYMTFRLYQAENPDMAKWYYEQFEKTLNDNIYWLNKDKRPVEEWFADTRYFSHY